jgi:hypothetical protein
MEAAKDQNWAVEAQEEKNMARIYGFPLIPAVVPFCLPGCGKVTCGQLETLLNACNNTFTALISNL